MKGRGPIVVAPQGASVLAIPIPFVVSLALAVLIGLVIARDGAAAWRRPGLAFLIVAALQATIVGLRWTTDWWAVRLIQPVTAALLPILALWLVADLGARPWPARRALVVAAVAMLGLAPLVLLRLPLVDFVLVVLFLGAGGRILVLALTPGSFDGARLGRTGQARAAALTLAVLLISGAALDVALAANLVHARDSAALLVSIGNLVSLAASAGATVVLGAARPEPTAHSTPPVARPGGDVDDAAVLADVAEALEREALWRDADLTLDRLARRAGWPARAISAAINRRHGMNVAQFVNRRRIEAAQALLAETDQPVTAIQFAVGFETKSNFNRAFRGFSQCSPSEWRQRARGGGDG